MEITTHNKNHMEYKNDEGVISLAKTPEHGWEIFSFMGEMLDDDIEIFGNNKAAAVARIEELLAV